MARKMPSTNWFPLSAHEMLEEARPRLVDASVSATMVIENVTPVTVIMVAGDRREHSARSLWTALINPREISALNLERFIQPHHAQREDKGSAQQHGWQKPQAGAQPSADS